MLREYARVVDVFGRFDLLLRFVGVEMLMDAAVESVASPELRITTETVERALSEAETLIHSSGAPGALDRAHTAFHGYLRAVCVDASLPFSADPSITSLFKIILRQHPVMTVSQTEEEIGNMVKGMSSIVDAINRLRNRRSMAHANEILLDDPEAMLAINSVRTLLHYLDSKLPS